MSLMSGSVVDRVYAVARSIARIAEGIKPRDIDEQTCVPSAHTSSVSGILRIYPLNEHTHLDDLPATGEFVIEILLNAGDDGGVMTLLDTVLRANDDLAGLHIPEDGHLLCRKSDHEHGNLVLQNLSCRDLGVEGVCERTAEDELVCGTYVDLADVENFAVADQALLQVLLHGRPENVVRLCIES